MTTSKKSPRLPVPSNVSIIDNNVGSARTRERLPRSNSSQSRSVMRLQKYLALCGTVSSRRKGEELIESGRVSVNGKIVVELGGKVDCDVDVVCVDSKRIKKQDQYLYLFHKPVKVITTLNDDRGRPCVGDFIKDLPVSVFPVGRLDFDVSGLLLLTNNGDYAQKLLHPRYGTERIYWALVQGEVKSKTIKALRAGVELSDGKALVKDVNVIKPNRTTARLLGIVPDDHSLIELNVQEGRNHFVKRLLEQVEHPVCKLVRVQFGQYKLGTLTPGSFTEIKRFS